MLNMPGQHRARLCGEAKVCVQELMNLDLLHCHCEQAEIVSEISLRYDGRTGVVFRLMYYICRCAVIDDKRNYDNLS